MAPLLRGPARWPLALAAALWFAAAGSGHAGILEDDEARKAILELRSRMTQNEEQSRALLAQQAEQITALRRSLLDLNNQLESARAEIARLRGSDEQLARDVAEMQRRQKDIAQAIDDRLRKFEPLKVSLDGKEFTAEPDEARAHDEAMALLRNGDFDKAAFALGNFQRRWPTSGYGPSVRFWQANALYGKREYKEAIGAFRSFVTSAPQHPRAPEALLALANSQAEMKDNKAARRTLEELLKSYPQSEAAVAGKERIAALK
jgi:tol-pal system protein YbgF